MRLGGATVGPTLSSRPSSVGQNDRPQSSSGNPMEGRRASSLAPLRVLMVNKFARVTGGADRCALSLTDALRLRGHDVRWVSTTSPANVECGWFVPALATSETRDALPMRARAAAARVALWNRSAYQATCEAIDSFRPDVVHAHKLYPQLSVAPIVAASRRGVPIVQTVHDYEFMSANPLDFSGRRVDRTETRASYRALNTALFVAKRRFHVTRVSRWIAPSRAIAMRYRDATGIDPRFITQFVDPVFITNRKFDERSGIGFAGRLAPEKGIGHLARAAALTREDFFIAGTGSEADRLSQPNIHLVGWVDGVTGFFSERRVVVIPSTSQENAPVVMFEAMLAGTPLVVYAVGGLAEYVHDAGAGVAVDPHPEALAAGIEYVLSDAEQWESMSAAGYAAARERYTAEQALPLIEAEYERAIAALKPSSRASEDFIG